MHSSKPARSRSTWTALSRALCTAAAVSMTMACASPGTPSLAPRQASQPPADLAAPCPDLPDLQDGTAAGVLRWITTAAPMYRDCAARHAGLIRAWPGQD